MTNLNLAKKAQTVLVAGTIALSSAPVKTGVLTGATALCSTVIIKEVGASEYSNLDKTKADVQYNGKTWKYKNIHRENKSWIMNYYNGSDKIFFTNDMNMYAINGLEGGSVVVDINNFSNSIIANSDTIVIKDRVRNIEDSYSSNNTNSNTTNNTINSNISNEDSLYTKKYKDLDIKDLEKKINEYVKQGTLNDSQINDYIDLSFEYSLKMHGMEDLPPVKFGEANAGAYFSTDSKTIIIADNSLVDKLKDTEFNFTTDVLRATVVETNRVFVYNKINYNKLDSFRTFVEKAETNRSKLDGNFEIYLNSKYTGFNNRSLLNSLLVQFYFDGNFKTPPVVKQIGNYVDHIEKGNYNNKGKKIDNLDTSLKGTLKLVGSNLKSTLPNEEEFLNDMQNSTKQIKDYNDLMTHQSDFTSYAYYVYSKQGMGLGNKTQFNDIASIMNNYYNNLKSNNTIQNTDSSTLINYVTFTLNCPDVTPQLVNEKFNMNMYSLSHSIMFYEKSLKVSEKPYTDQEWASIKDSVVQSMANIATKNKVAKGHSVWSEAFTKELVSDLKAKGIDPMRINKTIRSSEIEAKMKNLASVTTQNTDVIAKRLVLRANNG